MKYSANILAGGDVQAVATGTFNFLRITSATADFQISFDGSAWKESQKNDYFQQTSQRVYFRTVNAVAATVTFNCDINPIPGQDISSASASTVPQGNLGIVNGAAAAGGLPACDANGFLIITNVMNLKIPGTNANGNRRQIIIFSTSANSPAALQVMDANGFGFMTIPAGTVMPFVTDGDLLLSGAGGNAWVTVGQMFLKNQG